MFLLKSTILNYDSKNGFKLFEGWKKLSGDIGAASKQVEVFFGNFDKNKSFAAMINSEEFGYLTDETFKSWARGLDDTQKATLNATTALVEYKKHLSSIGTDVFSNKTTDQNTTEEAVKAGTEYVNEVKNVAESQKVGITGDVSDAIAEGNKVGQAYDNAVDSQINSADSTTSTSKKNQYSGNRKKDRKKKRESRKNKTSAVNPVVTPEVKVDDSQVENAGKEIASTIQHSVDAKPIKPKTDSTNVKSEGAKAGSELARSAQTAANDPIELNENDIHSVKEGVEAGQKMVSGAQAVANSDPVELNTNVNDASKGFLGFKKTLNNVGANAKKIGSTVANVVGGVAKDFAGMIGSFMLNTAASAVVQLLIKGAIALGDAVITTHKETKEAMDSSADSFNESKSKIESLNSELDSTRDKINELNSKEALTFVEQQELEKLQLQNDALERNIELEEIRSKIKAKQLAKDTEDAYEKLTENDVFGNVNNKYDKQKIDSYLAEYRDLDRHRSTVMLSQLDESDDINTLLAGRLALKQAMEDVVAEQEALDKSNAEDYKDEFESLQSFYDDYEGKLVDVETYIGDYVTEMSDIYTNYTDVIASGVNLTDSQEKQYQEARNFLNEYSKLYETGAEDSINKINGIFAKVKFKGLESELLKAAKEGRNALEDIIPDSFKQELEAAGVDIDNFIEHMMAIANPNAYKANEIRSQLGLEYAGSVNSSRDASRAADRRAQINAILGEVTDDDLITFNNYLKENNIDISSWNGETLKWHLDVALTGDVEEVKTFADILKNGSEDEDPANFSEYMEKYTANFSSLQTAIDSIKTGEFDWSTITDLQNQFPDLIGHTDNINELSTALNNIKLDQFNEFVTGYKEWVSTLSDPDEIKGAYDYLQSYINTLDFSDVNLGDIQKQLMSTHSDSFSKKSEMVERVKEVQDEFADELQSEEGREILYSLALNPESATWTIEQWREEYDNAEIYFDLKVKDESIAQINRDIQKLQDDKSATQAFHSYKQASGLDLTESDYDELIDENEKIIAKNAEKILANAIEIGTNKRLDAATKAALQSEIDAARIENTNLRSENVEHKRSKDSLPTTRLNNKISKLQSDAEAIDSKNYDALTENANEQIGYYENLIELKETELENIDAEEQSTLWAEVNSELSSYKTAVEGLESSKNQWGIGKLQDDLVGLEQKGQELQEALSLKELEGKDVVKKDYQDLIDNAKDQQANLDAQNAKLNEELLDKNISDTEEFNLKTQIFENESAFTSLTASILEYEQAIRDLPLNKLSKDMEILQSNASKLEASLSMKQAKGIKAVKQDYRDLISNSKKQIRNLQDQNSELRKQQSELNPLDSKYKDIQLQIDQNVMAIDEARMSQIEWNEAADLLDYEPNEGLLEYNKAKSTRNAGDNYLDMIAAAEEAQEARSKGLIGTDDFKTVAKLFSPNGMDDAANWDENYSKIKKYFTEDEKGPIAFLEDLEAKNLAAQDSMGNWTYRIDDVQGSADALGISFEAFLAVMGRLQDYGFTNDFFSSVEDGRDHINDLYVDLAEAENRMKELEYDREHGDLTVTDTVLAAQEARINRIKTSILESEDLLSQLSKKSVEDVKAETTGAILSTVSILEKSKELTGIERQKYLQDLYDSLEAQNIDLSHLFVFNEEGKVIDYVVEEVDRLNESTKAMLETSNQYADAEFEEVFNKLGAALEDPESKVKSLAESLSGFTQEQFEGVTFGDGVAETDAQLATIESAVDNILSALGLGQEYAAIILQLLGEAGYIDFVPKTNTEELTSGVEQGISDAQQSADSNPIIVPLKIESENSGVPSIQETANNQSPLSLALNLNTDYYNSTLDETLKETDEQGGTITIDGDNDPAKAAADEAVSYIESLNPEMKIHVDDVKVRNVIETALNEPFKINVQANLLGLPSSSSSSGSSDEGTHSLHGTAHAYGTFNSSLARSHSFGRACMTGDWGVKKSGNTLVGELGTEIVVDPRSGRWYTVGDNGAEFVDLPKDAIVFNHVQSQSLLENGYVNTRGKALASGNAYFNGDDGIKNGGTIDIPGLYDNSSLDDNTDALKDSTKAEKDNTKAIEEFQDWAGSLKDWVEVRLQRRQESIDLQLAKSENEIGYQDKNDRVTKAQNLTSKLIKNTRKGEKEYLDTADSVRDKAISKGLVSSKQANALIKKIQKGTIDVKEYDDEGVIEFINQYSTWWDKIVQCRQSVEDLKKSQEELAQQKLDNIVNRYDGIISHIEDRIAGIDNDIALAEAQGFADSGVYYGAKVTETNKAKAKKAAEIKALEDSLANDIASGKIVAPGKDSRGSEAWYEMQGLINDTKLEYEELEIQAQEYLNTQREINWAHEDAVQQNIQRINDEADFYKKLMQDEDRYDEDGNVTEHGKAMYGLEAVSYNVNMKDAEMYGKRKEELAKELALPKNKGNQKLIDEYNRLEEAQRGCILAAKDNKQAMVDYVKEGIEKQLAALQKLIDKYMDAIQSQKDMYDYQNNVQEQTEEIAKLQKRLAAYAGDDSEAGRLKRQETEKELKEAQKQLEETQYDKFISDQEELLSDLYD